MLLYIFGILLLISIVSGILQKEHYISFKSTLNTNIFDDILKQRKKEYQKFKLTNEKKNKANSKDNKLLWNYLRNNINHHTLQILKLRSDKKYREINSINNLINKVKQKYNNNMCKKYIRYYNFDHRNAIMVSPRFAELKPIIDVNTGEYSESKKECVHSNPDFINKFECPESIICPNRRRSSSPTHKLKNFEHVCEYTCL